MKETLQNIYSHKLIRFEKLTFEHILTGSLYYELKFTFAFPVGCQNTPAKSSRFCLDHNEAATPFIDDSKEMDGTITNNSEKGGDCKEMLVLKVLATKETRQGSYVQVFILRFYCKKALLLSKLNTLISTNARHIIIDALKEIALSV